LKLIKNVVINSDAFGVLACTLCLIHCIATPFIIISFNYSNIEQLASPIWWKSLDYIFLIISLIMVYFSVQTTSKSSMKYFFWFGWGLLFAMIMNEKAELLNLPEYMTYASALLLAGIHFYNLKYCQCKNDNIKDTFND